MFNRSTKLTALLVAAASVMSTVPAFAATKLANKEGTVENAVAFKDGKYLYEGYRTDDDDKGLYFNEGDKDKMLDDATKLGVKYDDKYVQACDGNDEYIVDLSTGKITDDDTVTDSKETAETKLQNKLKKADRYSKDAGDGANAKIADDAKVEGNAFGDVWYEYSATTAGGATAYGYTNGSGTYVDASFDLNIYVLNAKGKMVKIDDVEDTDEDVTVKSVKPVKTLGQDDKYIYRLIEVEVTGAYNVKDGSEVTAPLYYVQKIAKAQGDKEKDAYLPKSTDSYQVGEKLALNNGDVEDAYKVIKEKIVDASEDNQAVVRFVDGAMYVTYTDGDKVKTEKLLFKTSEKLKYKDSKTDKVDGHVVKKDTDTDTKIAEENSDISWTVDVNGTVWAIEGGNIKKSVKCGDFETVYTCDRSLDSIDVYDENNLIAWDNEGDVYTTVTEGSAQAKQEAEEIVGPATPATPAKTGWDQLADGTWNLYDVTGAKVTGWANVGGVWYFMDANGTMKTGWVQDGSTWYYCNASGAMQTGWVLDGSTWYYCNASGAMQTGWVQVNGTWYFLKSSGAMAANETIDGYYVNASGAWVR